MGHPAYLIFRHLRCQLKSKLITTLTEKKCDVLTHFLSLSGPKMKALLISSRIDLKCLKVSQLTTKNCAFIRVTNDTLACVPQKRQVHLAQQAELSITKFAVSHRIPEDAVYALPQLLQTLFADSELCKLLNVDRIQSMMLVRKVTTLNPLMPIFTLFSRRNDIVFSGTLKYRPTS